MRPSGASDQRTREAQVGSGGTMLVVGAEHGLARGENGTIVHVFDTADAYIVEFVNPADGSTRALAELTSDQLALPRRLTTLQSEKSPDPVSPPKES